jgi:hypothetical protein
VAGIREGRPQGSLFVGLPRERQIEHRGRRHHHDVVHQRDRLGAREHRPLLVQHRQQACDADLKGCGAIDVAVEDVERHAAARGVHVEQAGRRIEELVLRGGRLHPRRRWAAAHLGIEQHAQAAHARASERSHAS